MDTTFKVYILYSQRADQYYIGNTALAVEDRLHQHNNGQHTRAATKRGIPWNVYLVILCQSRLQARRVESHIKRMKSKKYVENLKRYPDMQHRLLDKYKQ